MLTTNPNPITLNPNRGLNERDCSFRGVGRCPGGGVDVRSRARKGPDWRERAADLAVIEASIGLERPDATWYAARLQLCRSTQRRPVRQRASW